MEHVFQVQGMTCGHCEMSVKKAILHIDPLAHIDINRQNQKVVVQSELPRESVGQAITQEGYLVV